MASISENMREAWASYHCRPGSMGVISFGPDEIRVAPETVDAWKALEKVFAAHGYDIRVEDTDSYNCREIKSGGSPSLHSYGIALDINWKTNPYLDHSGSRNPKFSAHSSQAERADDVRLGKADTDMTRAMVDAALAIKTTDGTKVFGWGGDWRTVKDAMHFQIEATPAQLKTGIDWSTVESVGEIAGTGTNMDPGDHALRIGSGGVNLPKVFFDTVRGPLFGGSLSQSAVDNMNLVVGYWLEKFPNNPLNQLAYILATVRAEVGTDMRPVREGDKSTDAAARQAVAGRRYGRPDGPHGHVYYGRGYVPLTWFSNYQAQSNKLGIDLVANPDLALDPSVAIEILVDGILDGDFNGQGHGLAFYVDESKQDFVNARWTVNKLDRAEEIAGFARKFLEALTLAVQRGLRFMPSVLGGAPMEGWPDMGTGQASTQPSDLVALLRDLLLGSNASSQPDPAPPPKQPQSEQNAQLVAVLTALLAALAQRREGGPTDTTLIESLLSQLVDSNASSQPSPASAPPQQPQSDPNTQLLSVLTELLGALADRR